MPHNSNANSTSGKRSCATKHSSMFASVRRRYVLKLRHNLALSVRKFVTVFRDFQRKWTPSKKWLRRRCENQLLSKSKVKLTWMKRNYELESVSSVRFNPPIHALKSDRSGCNQSRDKRLPPTVQGQWTRPHSVPGQMDWVPQQDARCADSWVSKTSLNHDLVSVLCAPQ